ncbi:MAG: DUF3090 family protein [Actinomycetota bacterium]
MSEIELFPETITADAVGDPGERTFFIQVGGDFGSHTYLVEKEQVTLLAEKLREMLMLIDTADPIRLSEPARDPGLALSEPADPEFRVGSMGLAYDDDTDRVLLFVQPVGEGEEEEEREPVEETGVRFVLRRDQVRTFVLHALAVVAEGRPICQLCGLAMDPEGHDCPARNGHRLGSF